MKGLGQGLGQGRRVQVQVQGQGRAQLAQKLVEPVVTGWEGRVLMRTLAAQVPGATPR